MSRMDGERLPESQVEEVLRLLLGRGHDDAAVLLGEARAIKVGPHRRGGVRLQVTMDDVVGEELGRGDRRQITDALTEVLAASGRTVTKVVVKKVPAGLSPLVADDLRPWRTQFVDRFRTHAADERFVYLACAAVAFVVPVAIVLGTNPSWVWAAWLAGGWTCAVLLLMFWRWLDPNRPFTRGHATRVVEVREEPMSTAALCSCGWIGPFGDSIDAAHAAARRHATAEPAVLRSADVMRIMSAEAALDGPQEEPG